MQHNALLNIDQAQNETRYYGAMLSSFAELDFGKIWTPLEGIRWRTNFGAQYRNAREGSYYGNDFTNPLGYASTEPNVAYNNQSQKLAWTLENMILGIGEYRDYETYLPKCKEITEQLGDMIRDILNASRLQTQGNNEPCSNFSLRALLTELCEPYRLIAEAKGIKFKIELSSDAFVYLPEGRLKKAISNILSNAVNYTEAGQSISVVFDKNKLSVSNECSVLPPEQLQHIFEPFYRPDLAHSQATGGNGLGLYIVQTILDKLRLEYQFVPMPNDRGMSFTIQF